MSFWYLIEWTAKEKDEIMISNDTFVRMQLIANPSIFPFTVSVINWITKCKKKQITSIFSKLYSIHWWIEIAKKKHNKSIISIVVNTFKMVYFLLRNESYIDSKLEWFFQISFKIVVSMNKRLPFVHSACALNDSQYLHHFQCHSFSYQHEI